MAILKACRLLPWGSGCWLDNGFDSLRPKTREAFLAIALSLFSLAQAEELPAPSASSAPSCEKCAFDKAMETIDPTMTPMLPVGERSRLSLDFILTSHDGSDVRLSSYAGKVLALAFIYTRCTNPRKCPLAATTMEALRQQLAKSGLGERVQLLLVTLDPEHDTPEVVTAYAAERNIALGAGLDFLRPHVYEKEALCSALQVPASFAEGGVAMHGVQLLIVDKRGCLGRKYSVVVWDNDRVFADLSLLAAE